MKYLTNQTQFEELIGKIPSEYPISDLSVIWFSAEWCNPCKKINIDYLMENFKANWLKCDIDQNDYTAGYCNIRSIPSFLVVYKKKIIDIKSHSDTNTILLWLENLTLN